jgi:hypothetical protein
VLPVLYVNGDFTEIQRLIDIYQFDDLFV